MQLEAKELQLKRKLEEHQQDVKLIEWLIEKKCDKLQVKEKENDMILISIKDKEGVFDHIQGCILEGEEKLVMLEKCIPRISKEAESKSKELDSIRFMKI